MVNCDAHNMLKTYLTRAASAYVKRHNRANVDMELFIRGKIVNATFRSRRPVHVRQVWTGAISTVACARM